MCQTRAEMTTYGTVPVMKHYSTIWPENINFEALLEMLRHQKSWDCRSLERFIRAAFTQEFISVLNQSRRDGLFEVENHNFFMAILGAED